MSDREIARRIIPDYQVDRVFTFDEDGALIAERLLPEALCDRITVNRPGVLEKIEAKRFKTLGGGSLIYLDSSACIVDHPETSRRPVYEVRTRQFRDRTLGREGQFVRYDLRSPDGRLGRVTGGVSQVLFPIPIPIILPVLGGDRPHVEFLSRRKAMGAPSTLDGDSLLIGVWAKAVGLPARAGTPLGSQVAGASSDPAVQGLLALSEAAPRPPGETWRPNRTGAGLR